jgi:uncharacterized membrane protein
VQFETRYVRTEGEMLERLFLWLEHNWLIVALNSSVVTASILEVVHYFSIFVLVGATAIVDLRLLGLAGRRQPAAPLNEQLFLWVWVGFGFAVLSGFFMFAADAPEYLHNSIFHRKVEVVLLAAVLGAIVQRKVPKWDRSPSIPLGAKLWAIVSLLSWIWAILMGVNVPALTGVG